MAERGNADIFPLAQMDRLPQFIMEYHRPPSRVSHIPMRVLAIDGTTLCCLSEMAPKEPIRFDGAVVLERGYWGAWFVANGTSHDLGKVYSADGRHTGYYVDVLEPVRWQGEDVSTIEPFTDLFLDLWLAPDGRWQVLDEPEFAEAEARGWITDAQAAHARQTLAEIVDRAKAGTLVPPAARAFDLRF